jgi:hypothetical protein
MVTSLNISTPAREAGYEMMQYICGRNTITADATTPTKVGTLPAGAVIVGISSKVVTAVTGGTPAFGIGTTAATVGTAGTIVTTMAETAGSEWLLPLASLVQPLAADTDVYIGALTGGGTAGDVIITVFFVKPLA